MSDTAEVFNGTVKAGDNIAYSTRTGSHQDMNIATVIEVRNKPHAWKTGLTVQALKVHVTKSSGYHDIPRNVTISVLDRVVKL